MAAKKKAKQEASSNKDDAFFVYEDEKKDLGTSSPNNNDATNTKNILYIYKDKSTCRVCYDGKDPHYITVHIG